MKKNIYSLIACFFLFSGVFAQRTIVVTNSTAMVRKGEIVEVKANALKACFKSKSYILKNDKGEEIPYQLLYNESKKPRVLIFQADVNPNASSTYTLSEGKPAPVQPRTSARFVPERKDDFAWENDLAAYRMYGPALANENPSNGVDLWLKRTNKLIVDTFYYNELKKEQSYHIDHGNGLDCYKVGHTLGAGGIAPYMGDSLWVGNYFNSYRVLENGPLRAVFSLTYDSVKVDKVFYKQVITITTSAGSLLNKAVVQLIGKKQPIKLAAGIFLHDGKGSSLKEDETNGVIAYAENAVSDAGVPSGRNYIGVYIPDSQTKSIKSDAHILLLADYKVGKEFTYYFGGGWSKWGFKTDADWFNALNHFTETIRNPLKVTLK
ncbi:MAG: DUF4861 family protein [Paludibacter sp.]